MQGKMQAAMSIIHRSIKRSKGTPGNARVKKSRPAQEQQEGEE